MQGCQAKGESQGPGSVLPTAVDGTQIRRWATGQTHSAEILPAPGGTSCYGLLGKPPQALPNPHLHDGAKREECLLSTSCVLSSLCRRCRFILPITWDLGPILQRRKLKFRMVKKQAQGHVASKTPSGVCSAASKTKIQPAVA